MRVKLILCAGKYKYYVIQYNDYWTLIFIIDSKPYVRRVILLGPCVEPHPDDRFGEECWDLPQVPRAFQLPWRQLQMKLPSAAVYLHQLPITDFVYYMFIITKTCTKVIFISSTSLRYPSLTSTQVSNLLKNLSDTGIAATSVFCYKNFTLQVAPTTKNHKPLGPETLQAMRHLRKSWQCQ